MRHLARLLSAPALALLVVVGVSAVLSPPVQARTWAPSTDPEVDPRRNLEEFEDRILEKINEARVDAGLREVRLVQSCVDGKSEHWARRIKRTGDLVHRDQMTVIRQCDLMWTGETLVRGVGLTPDVAVQAWMSSPSHRAVVMKPRARWAGVAVRVDGEGRTIGVLNFGDAS